ncbi:FliH/SctL family protein [Halothiobacillus diazotrophicus]|uniref:FliH/SctL family protein n=1 Tax=Halothiobacillus diazotrophicus TaxID=1860122 RepID=UPI0012E77B11|nr:FliH/SctL family protein [Halothiobacillus diazotrophicus]
MSSSSDPAATKESPVIRPLDPGPGVTAWSLPELNQVIEPVAADPVDEASAPVPSEADLIEAHRAAAQNGYAEGKALGHKAGYEAGYAEGMAAARDEIERLERRLQGWLHTLAQPLADLDKEVSAQLARLSMQIARSILYRELTLAPEQIEVVAREALTALPAAVRKVVLICHPEDLAALEASVQAGSLAQARGQSFEIRSDESILPGGLRIESGDSEIQAAVDARLDARWAALSLRLLGTAVPGPGEPIPVDQADDQPTHHSAPEANGPSVSTSGDTAS